MQQREGQGPEECAARAAAGNIANAFFSMLQYMEDKGIAYVQLHQPEQIAMLSMPKHLA